jgi:FdhD protein
MNDGVRPAQYVTVDGATGSAHHGEIVDEAQVCLSLNGQEIANMMCTPIGLDCLALGFLYNEGIIESVADVRLLQVAQNDRCIDVWLHQMDVEPPRRRVLTSGCGGGLTFDDLSGQHEPLPATGEATRGQLSHLMRQMHLGATLYRRARGIHTAAFARGDALVLQVEDLGRHNCLDKLRGAAMLAGMDTAGGILLTSGRVSSEMINKARRLETPIVCSRTSPTSLSVALAEQWNMTIVGYLRQDKMRVYSHPERLGLRV